MSLNRRKAVIIGAGHVGSHGGFTLASQGLVNEVVYIDVDMEKAKAQALDISDAVAYLPQHVTVKIGDYTDARDADLMIIAAGPLPDMSKGQTRMDTLHQTIPIIKDIVDNIKNSGFQGIIINITNPADVVTHYMQHMMKYPSKRIISTSTTLDSARLRRTLSEKTGIDQKSIYAYALGEHGESQMVPWSAATIAGKPLFELMKEKPETYGGIDLNAIAAECKAGGWQILGGKGSTEFGIGAAIAEVTRAIFGDENRVLPVSTLLQGQYGQYGVYASVPAVLNNRGVEEIIELRMTETEQAEFNSSCKALKENFQLALLI